MLKKGKNLELLEEQNRLAGLYFQFKLKMTASPSNKVYTFHLKENYLSSIFFFFSSKPRKTNIFKIN